MITKQEAQQAKKVLIDYISQCKGEISECQAIINQSTIHLNLPEDFTIENMDLSVRAYNTLRSYYEHYKGSTIFNTSELKLLRIRDCGKKTVREIKDEFGKYGIKLLR